MMKDKNTQSYVAIVMGAAIVVFVGLTVLLNSVTFLLHGEASFTLLVISLLVTLYGVYYLLRDRGRAAWVGPIALVAVILLSVFLASSTIDSSFDGNWYHKEAVGLLKEGWNPVYESSKARTYMYVDAYPKASWIFASNLYSVTGNIESGKAIGPLVIAAVLFVVFGYLRRILDARKSILLAAVAALSPVAVSQVYTFYVDGVMGGLLIILTIFLNMIVGKRIKIPAWVLYSTLIFLIVLLINLKYTGLAYAGVTAVVYWAYIALKRDKRSLITLTSAGIVALVVGIFLVGAPTYVKNYLVHKQPLYPLMGPEAVDIITPNQPSSYGQKNRVHKFLESNLGETMSITASTDDKIPDSPLKIPFSIKIEELKKIAEGVPDMRQAGYGVWFGGALLLTAFGIVLLAVRLSRYRRENIALFVLPVIPVAIIAIAFEESWWARYLPQLIIAPVVVIVALLLTKEYKRTLPHILILALAFNVILIGLLGVDHQFKYRRESLVKIERLIENCKDGNQAEFVAMGALSMGSRFNVKDRCPDASFKSVSESQRGELTDWEDVWYGIHMRSSSDVRK